MNTLIDWKRYNIEIVGIASDGQSGFDLIIEKQPQIVLTDIRMPMVDGLSIYREGKVYLSGIYSSSFLAAIWIFHMRRKR